MVVDLVVSQTGKPPFSPRNAVAKFAESCKRYKISTVQGDKYLGQTFVKEFQDHNITYHICKRPKHELYEEFEPLLNAGEVELLDQPKLQQQLLGLVWRGTKIDHQNGEHDDWANAVAGAVWSVLRRKVQLPFWV